MTCNVYCVLVTLRCCLVCSSILSCFANKWKESASCAIATWNRIVARPSGARGVLGSRSLTESLACAPIVERMRCSRKTTSCPSLEAGRAAQTTSCSFVNGVTRTRVHNCFGSGCRRYQSKCHNTITLILYFVLDTILYFVFDTLPYLMLRCKFQSSSSSDRLKSISSSSDEVAAFSLRLPSVPSSLSISSLISARRSTINARFSLLVLLCETGL